MTETPNSSPESSGQRIDRRILVLTVAGLIIFGSAWWASQRDRTQSLPKDASTIEDRRAAPAFRLYDQNSQLVNLGAYLNRHRIILVFFDSGEDASDEALLFVRQQYQELTEAGFKVFGVSTALPQQNRARYGEDFPFPLLSEPTAASPDSVHRRWNRLIAPGPRNPEPQTRPGVFVIDRMGRVAWERGFPKTIDSIDGLMEISGRH